MSLTSGVYAIINLKNNKLYVGSAINFKIRWREHKNRLNKNTHHNNLLQKAWNKYGEENFKFQILAQCSKEKLNELISMETYWIDLINSTDRNIGYNFCKEGKNNLGVKRSQETKDKISASLKGKPVPIERRIKTSNAMKGIKFHPDRKTNKGKPWSEKT